MMQNEQIKSSFCKSVGIPVAMLFIILLSGTHLSQERVESAHQKLFAEKMAAMEQYPSAVSTDIRVRTLGEKETFFEGALLLLPPDKIRADIFSPIGTIASIIVVDEQQIAVATPADNSFYQGCTSRNLMARAMFLPVMPSEAVGILLGSVELLQRNMTLVGASEKKGGSFFSFSRDGEKRRMHLDGKNYLRAYDGTIGGEPFQTTFRYHNRLPARIEVKYKDNEIEIEILHQKEEELLSPELFDLSPVNGTHPTGKF